jgi:hypothetical protein
MLTDVVTRHGEFFEHWVGHDVYVSGSAPMVRATIARLQELNIPLASIRFDAYGGVDGSWQPGTGQGVPTPPPAPVASAQGAWRRDNGWRAGVAGLVPPAQTIDEWLVSQTA